MTRKLLIICCFIGLLCLFFSYPIKAEEKKQKEKDAGKYYEIYVEATAYSADTGEWTCTGDHVHEGIIAVDPKVIPLGTKIYIDGMGWFTALDTGRAIVGNKIDIFFERYEDMVNFGRRWLKIRVYY